MDKLRCILSIGLLSITALLFAQTVNEAGEAFNEGILQTKEKNYDAAITAYKNCIDICKSIGEGGELLAKAESQIVLAYYNMGLMQYKSKEFDKAVKSLKKSEELGKKINDTETAEKSVSYIARVYNSKGTSLYSNNDYDNALKAFEEALKYDPSYFKAYYGKGLVYSKKKNTEAFKASIDKAIELGSADDKTVKKAKAAAANYYVAEAGKSIQAGLFEKAVEMLNISFGYANGNAQTYYFAAIAYNGLSKWAKAIESGEKALNMEQKNKSNIYFELGKAYEGAGKTTEACTAYTNVADGPNQEVAQHKISQELNCK